MTKIGFSCCPHDHQDDSYGSCTICREYVPHTDDEMRTVAWPCAVVREARLRRIEEAARALSDSVQTVEITDGEYVRLNSTGPQEVWHLFCAALEEKPPRDYLADASLAALDRALEEKPDGNL